MKKVIAFLTLLVLILGGSLVYVLTTNDNDAHSDITNEKPINNNESIAIADDKTYQFKNIENLEKAKSIDEAFNKIFGNNRLFEDKSINYDRDYVSLGININPRSDIRMEMIDFLNYVQYSNLISTNSIKDQMKEHTGRKGPNDFYTITMYVYQVIKPGMNSPKAHLKWSISTSQLEQIDFSDKETLLNEINSYGNFELIDPS